MSFRPPMSSPFPYTTLFRSRVGGQAADLEAALLGQPHLDDVAGAGHEHLLGVVRRLRPLRQLGQRRLRVAPVPAQEDRKSTRLNSSHLVISYAVFCLKKKDK